MEIKGEITMTRIHDGYCITYRDNRGRLHRKDGPAAIYPNGVEYWYYNGVQHRVGGPSVIFSDGGESWHTNGKWVDNLIGGEKDYADED